MMKMLVQISNSRGRLRSHIYTGRKNVMTAREQGKPHAHHAQTRTSTDTNAEGMKPLYSVIQ